MFILQNVLKYRIIGTRTNFLTHFIYVNNSKLLKSSLDLKLSLFSLKMLYFFQFHNNRVEIHLLECLP